MLCTSLGVSTAAATELDGEADPGRLDFRHQPEPGSEAFISMIPKSWCRPMAASWWASAAMKPAAGTLRVRAPSGSEETESSPLTVAPREYEIRACRRPAAPHRDTLIRKPRKRIQQECRDGLQSARARRDPESLSTPTALPGRPRGRISGVYGSQRVLNGEPRRPHFGLDIAAPIRAARCMRRRTASSPWPIRTCISRAARMILDHGQGLSSSIPAPEQGPGGGRCRGEKRRPDRGNWRHRPGLGPPPGLAHELAGPSGWTRSCCSTTGRRRKSGS